MEVKESILKTAEFLMMYNANSLVNTCRSFNIDPLNIKADMEKLDNNTLHVFNNLLDNNLPKERKYLDDENNYELDSKET